MTDFAILGGALLVTLWASWPPRSDRRRWLLLGFGALWAGLVGVGWRRGILPGFAPWLVALSMIGALLGLLVLWSIAALVAHPRAPTPPRESDE